MSLSQNIKAGLLLLIWVLLSTSNRCSGQTKTLEMSGLEFIKPVNTKTTKFQIFEFRNALTYIISPEYYFKISTDHNLILGCSYTHVGNFNTRPALKMEEGVLGYALGLKFTSFNLKLLSFLSDWNMEALKISVTFKI